MLTSMVSSTQASLGLSGSMATTATNTILEGIQWILSRISMRKLSSLGVTEIGTFRVCTDSYSYHIWEIYGTMYVSCYTVELRVLIMNNKHKHQLVDTPCYLLSEVELPRKYLSQSIARADNGKCIFRNALLL